MYALCLSNSSCSSFHSANRWAYGGASGHLPLLLPFWSTFRDGNVFLKFAPNPDVRILRPPFLTEVSVWAQECLAWVHCGLSHSLTVHLCFQMGVHMEVSNCKNFPEISPRAVICNIHNWRPLPFFSDTFALPLPFGLVDRSFFCESMDGQSFPIWHLPFLKYLQCGRRPCWHSQSMFFSRWTFPCLCGVLSFCESVSLYQASWSSSFAFPFFAVSCSKEHFLPFEHEPFDIQDRQSRYFSPAPFEEYAAACSVSWSFFEKTTFCCCCSRMSLTMVLDLW